MAEIRRLLWMRHLRAEATNHVLYYRKGELLRAGRGLAFWFNPMAAALAEVPVDHRDLNYLFKGRTHDYQEVVVQGVITYRVVDAERLAQRVDFAIDLKRGTHIKQPLDQIAILLTGIAQQAGLQVIARAQVAELMVNGFGELAAALEQTLHGNTTLEALGIAVENVRIDELKPTAELERALQTPTREGLQQRADEATFMRRALAVEKERAIAENELQTQVELARRQEALIAQQGQNARQKVEQETEARRLGVVALAEDQRIEAKPTPSARCSRPRARQRASDCTRPSTPRPSGSKRNWPPNGSGWRERQRRIGSARRPRHKPRPSDSLVERSPNERACKGWRRPIRCGPSVRPRRSGNKSGSTRTAICRRKPCSPWLLRS